MRTLLLLIIIMTGFSAHAGSMDSVVDDLFYNSLSNFGGDSNTKNAIGSAQKAFVMQNYEQEKNSVAKTADHLVKISEDWAKMHLSEDMQKDITIVVLAAKVVSDKAIQFNIATDMKLKVGIQAVSFAYNF
jgi:hypothetical protein